MYIGKAEDARFVMLYPCAPEDLSLGDHKCLLSDPCLHPA